MSMITSSNRQSGQRKGGFRRNENNRIYANPLPLIFSPIEHTRIWPSHILLGILGFSSSRIANPHCEGIFDAATRSVWVSNAEDSMTLWRRGFFGKGNLSRSEPSWLARRINARKIAENGLTAEEVTAKRRAERKQFKLDRAQAIAEAAAAAELAFSEGRIITTEETGIVIPSAATWKPHSSTAPKPTVPPPLADDNIEEEEDIPENMEHLQLTLQEAFFLLWTMDCLSVLDPNTNTAMSVQQIWIAFQAAHFPPHLPIDTASILSAHRFDNPFLINYAVYHHYRSLGWVVKNGIKFCADYMLYKRGPVFHHAEFAVVVCPVYEDPSDQESSPFDLQNASPFAWSWLSTINRVNSQVQKTLILTYVTIPARSRIPASLLSTPACLRQYSVREVTIRRFIPARMRD
ncbi:hypothetical protein JAAARDRAFT_122938 [Jaapia argillacea MUCL 33604]|uniref:tRNA-splicing endonuclease subunit Sen2 n=1 Tax=Jaapia argillacea MUCL 33604 TaxID=933084 RepID=A0A067QDM0_9AGAM|nr:hypothetical protein JAAARDRAFT_122938 [Jaapia argillacea MUCL 33604]